MKFKNEILKNMFFPFKTGSRNDASSPIKAVSLQVWKCAKQLWFSYTNIKNALKQVGGVQTPSELLKSFAFVVTNQKQSKESKDILDNI